MVLSPRTITKLKKTCIKNEQAPERNLEACHGLFEWPARTRGRNVLCVDGCAKPSGLLTPGPVTCGLTTFGSAGEGEGLGDVTHGAPLALDRSPTIARPATQTVPVNIGTTQNYSC